MNKPQTALQPDVLAATHEVSNQTPPLQDYNVFQGDTALVEAVRREGGEWGLDALRADGARTGSEEVIAWGYRANAYKPELHAFDRQGHRIDQVLYHEDYHRLMAHSLRAGIHSAPWADPRPGAHVVRSALQYMHYQMDAGHHCPVTMTFACVPAIRTTPSVAEHWLPGILNADYDPRDIPHTEKRALTIGMGMTEKQGGSDVRANTTRAWPVGGDTGAGAGYELVGHKWFTSAPMCDGFLMLAQSEGGLSCFLVPRWRPDGTRNALQVQRLKNKAGNVSNASSEIELRGAFGWMLGEEGRGVPTIIEMVAMTRYDCMVGSTASMRQATAQAIHHCAHRTAFGKRLIDQPAMANVLADLQLEVEGALALTMRMGRALDHQDEEREKLLLRLGLPTGKYWVCKRNPNHAYEAMECIGGNGVMDDFIMARLYRDAPINAIWEGSGNVQALDLLRAMVKSPDAVAVWMDELEQARGAHTVLDTAVDRLKSELADRDAMDYRARALTERMSLCMQAALLVRAGNHNVADAFIASRLDPRGEHNYGCLPRGIDVAGIIDRGNPLTD
ncbi:acyl-CoA dehydrogenase family protein [Algiphilus sp.]|uniref:acyl-CoA dehydrogenase family protein n=1 Tax=Algiphilus sp. TaxID=1872431 RepID=UPI0025BA6844|nr:acyl-CoA dehydrogenase family protein [Algiphilus sp.]MCK5769433.1 acyl-CoA dehydrogenase family protein [Algiphilus sp.]